MSGIVLDKKVRKNLKKKLIICIIVVVILAASTTLVAAELCDPDPHPEMRLHHYDHTLMGLETCWAHVNCIAEYWKQQAIYKCTACDLMEPIGSPDYYYLHSNPE